MAKLVFRLNDAPDEEADGIRALLTEHDIDFYETNSGNWGFSVAGIWVRQNDDKLKARKLIDEYQLQHYSDLSVEVDSFFQSLIKHPFRTVFFLTIIVFILYFSVMPFLGIGSLIMGL